MTWEPPTAAFDIYTALSDRINADFDRHTQAMDVAAGNGVAALLFGSVTTPLDAVVQKVLIQVDDFSSAPAVSPRTIASWSFYGGLRCCWRGSRRPSSSARSVDH